MGYALYVVFPAAPPRLVLVYEFTKNLRGYPVGFSNLSAQAFSLLPVDSRAAFPSLHAAASLVALVYAWRYLRWWFWVLLPFALGLWVSTIYLRHHYFVDLVAGWLLAPVAVWARPARGRVVGAAAAGARLRAGTRRRAARPGRRLPVIPRSFVSPGDEESAVQPTLRLRIPRDPCLSKSLGDGAGRSALRMTDAGRRDCGSFGRRPEPPSG